MVRGFFILAKIALRYAQDNLGVKKVLAPSKNPSKCSNICFAREKQFFLDFQNQNEQ
jgi:hypothetical protein